MMIREAEAGRREAEKVRASVCASALPPKIVVKRLGLVEYDQAYRAMRQFTARRGSDIPDEIWLIEHAPVYTTGLNGNNAHFPKHDSGIPVIATDRGGQITYHGPGQAIVYLLLDLKRKKLGIRAIVGMMEQAVIEVLRAHSVIGHTRAGMPGVYVNNAKIAAVGLRVTRGCCYHGLALNVAMDLSPFRFINPCGYPALPITQTTDLGIAAGVDELANKVSDQVIAMLERP